MKEKDIAGMTAVVFIGKLFANVLDESKCSFNNVQELRDLFEMSHAEVVKKQSKVAKKEIAYRATLSFAGVGNFCRFFMKQIPIICLRQQKLKLKLVKGVINLMLYLLRLINALTC